MIDFDVFIKYWRLPELQGLSLVAAVERMLKMEFKKASIKEIIKHKIKWIVKILNYPFKKLEELM